MSTSSRSSRRPTRARWRVYRWSWAHAAPGVTRRSRQYPSTSSSHRSDVKVLVVGAGGREHAIVRALKRSPQRPELLCTPGNAGIAADARLLDVAVDDIDGMLAAVQREGVDFTVVGPEVPLVAGLVDVLAKNGHAAFGPSAAAAQLEGSKACQFQTPQLLKSSIPVQILGSQRRSLTPPPIRSLNRTSRPGSTAPCKPPIGSPNNWPTCRLKWKLRRPG